MALEAGGYAAKLGDRYEGRWVVRQLLLLLQERIRGVSVEAVGDDEAGVDLWIDRLDGTRDAQQCKAENGTKNAWTVADLKRRGVLDYAKRQLARNPDYTFTFVSGVPATDVRDLSRSARDSSGDAEDYYRDQIVGRSREASKSFGSLCHFLDLDSDELEDRRLAYDFLRRLHFHLFSDDRESREELRYMAQLAVEGNPDHVINALADFAESESNLRRCLTAQDIWDELTRLDLPPRHLSADPRLAVCIKELNDEFAESIQPTLAAGTLIPRTEANALLSIIDEDYVAETVILHGAAGRGKSGVLYEFTQQLKMRGVPFLAIRLDRKSLRGSARQFGVDLGLRESPVRCLHELAVGQRCVLILDQLDALRWTSAHAAEGLEVCKAMLREVFALRSLGSQVTTVLCCRTFDLEHDPQIKAWLTPNEQHPIEKVGVEDLPASAVESVVRELGLDYSRFSPRQKELLRTINNLAIWAEVAQSEDRSPDFGSHTQLLRVYWRNRFQLLEKAGISPADRTALLNRLVDYMEQTAIPSAPARLLEQHQTIATELQSLGVVRVSGRAVTFAHQTHLDFLIADRVLQNLTSERDAVLAWLGDRYQMSLIRREQLRQLLLLLIDEDPDRFVDTVRSIVESADVRFHMKQLALEVLGQIVPNESVLNFVMDMHAIDEWREHIEGEVISGNPDYVRALTSRGILSNWLASTDESEQRLALWLLRRNCDKCEDIVVQQCSPLLERGGDWPTQVEAVLGRNMTIESHDIFKLRVECARRGATPMHVAWQELAEKKPNRAVHLFAAILEGDFRSTCEKSVRTRHYGRREDPSLATLTVAAKQSPKLACRLLSPLFANYVRRAFAEVRNRVREGGVRNLSPFDENRTPPSLSKVLNAGLSSLAESHPERFLKFAAKMERLPGRVARRMLVEGHAHLPREHADDSIRWLLEDLRRLSCGSRRKEPRWMPARRLIRSMSPHCSEGVFRELEATLLRYNDPDEIRRSKFNLRYLRHGIYENSVGAAQYHLLPALYPDRRSAETIGRIGVLRRKFEPLGQDFFITEGPRGGWVRSPLDSTRIDHMSDKAWLELITNGLIPAHDNERKARYLKNSVIEVSVEQFSRDLQVAALRDPERFAKLALRIPDIAPPEYLSAIMFAVDRKGPPSEVPEDRRDAWMPASTDAVKALLERALNLDDTEQAKRFCWIVCNRDDITITDQIIDLLCHCCRHQDPPENELHVRCDVAASKCNVHDLEVNSINCVRGVAARAISRILYDEPDLLSRFRSTIEQLLDDPHPVVRVAAAEICLPVWNINKPLSVDWFSRAASPDLRVAASREGCRLYNYCLPKFHEQVGPIIERMVDSPIAEVAEAGAGEVAARWAFHGLFGDVLPKCISGTDAQRKGVAEALMHLAHRALYSENCLPLLIQLAADDNEEIRQQVNILFRYDDVLGVPGFHEFLQDYLKSKAFQDDPSHLIDALEDHKASLSELSEIVLTVSHAFLTAWSSTEKHSERHGWAAAHHLVPLTLRLYAQAASEGTESIRERCLDFWDEMLRHRITSGSELAKGLTE